MLDTAKCKQPIPKDINDTMLLTIIGYLAENIGMSKIDDSYLIEFYARARLYEEINGTHRNFTEVVDGKAVVTPLYISLAEVNRWKGL